MVRILLAVLVWCFALSAPAVAADQQSAPQRMDALMRHYDASDVAEGKVHVDAAGDLAYISGTSAEGPWLEVWRLTAGEWKKIGEVVTTQLSPIRFGVKRDRPCRRTS